MKKLLHKVKVIFDRDRVKMTKVILYDILFHNFGPHTKKTGFTFPNADPRLCLDFLQGFIRVHSYNLL